MEGIKFHIIKVSKGPKGTNWTIKFLFYYINIDKNSLCVW